MQAFDCHPSLTDRELAAKFTEDGDESAFNALVERHSGRAYQIAMGILNNREDAEEVTQDAFIRIFRSLASFRWECEFTTWLYTIVTNLSRNKHRWNKIRGKGKNFSINAPLENSHDGDDLYFDIPDPSLPPDEEMELKELQGNVAAAMAALPESYRTAVLLRNVQHMDYEGIAKVLNCKIGTVKSKIARGRDQLRQLLNKALN